jgi:hypothetical protein
MGVVHIIVFLLGLLIAVNVYGKVSLEWPKSIPKSIPCGV